MNCREFAFFSFATLFFCILGCNRDSGGKNNIDTASDIKQSPFRELHEDSWHLSAESTFDESISAIAFSPDDEQLFVAKYDRTGAASIVACKVDDLSVMSSELVSVPISEIEFSKDGSKFLTKGLRGSALFELCDPFQVIRDSVGGIGTFLGDGDLLFVEEAQTGSGPMTGPRIKWIEFSTDGTQVYKFPVAFSLPKQTIYANDFELVIAGQQFEVLQNGDTFAKEHFPTFKVRKGTATSWTNPKDKGTRISIANRTRDNCQITLRSNSTSIEILGLNKFSLPDARSVCWSNDGRKFAIFFLGGTVAVWDRSTE